MIDCAEAMQRIVRAMPERPTQRVDIGAAGGQILAQQAVAERDQPPFDRVMMDGIALNHAAFANGTTHFRRQGIQAAGAQRQSLSNPANCIEVMTGAMLPAGCDSVVPVEQVSLTGDFATLEPGISLRQSQFIHGRGSDYRRHEVLLQRGTRIGGPEMAVLASAGQATVEIARQPNIGIIAVGDELADPGAELGATQIRRSNDFAIEALLHDNGLDETTRARLPDDPEILRQAIAATLEQTDILVLTGGVSMGKYDYIPEIMGSLGVEILLHRVAQMPGKPMWVGRRDQHIVFALPGNPVSALVCARRYVVPAIQGAMGFSAREETVPLSRALEKTAPLAWFVPVLLQRRDAGMVAEPRQTNTSGDFHTLSRTTGFVELPAELNGFPAGYPASLWRW